MSPSWRARALGRVLQRRPRLVVLFAFALALEVMAGAGLAYLAGFHRVLAVLGHWSWPWLLAAVGGIVVSLVGYFYAYRGIIRVEDGPSFRAAELRAILVTGFGGFLAHGGSAADVYALEGAGEPERAAKVRVTALAGLEHGILSLLGTLAAIVVLAKGLRAPPEDVSLPWAVIPLPGLVLALWLVGRPRRRRTDVRGWRASIGIFFDSIGLIRHLFADATYWPALAGMFVFWVADAFAGWAGIAGFGHQMYWASFFIGFATGMVFTRRMGPFAGAGVLALVIPLTIWYSGAPLAVAVVGIFSYRVLSLLVPTPFALASLGTLHRIGRGAGATQHEPALE